MDANAHIFLRFVQVWLLSCAVNPALQAQPAPPQPEESQPASADDLTQYLWSHLPGDPSLSSQVELAREQIADGQVSAGLTLLQTLLDQQSDLFLATFDDSGQLKQTTLRQLVDDIIRNHRDEYQRLVGSQAQALLAKGVSDQNLEIMLEVVRRYEQSDAGAQALGLLARQAWASGEPGLGARLYERLQIHPRPQISRGEISVRLAASWYLGQRSARSVSVLQANQPAINQFLNDFKLPVIPAGGEVAWLQQVAGQLAPLSAEPELKQWRTPHGGIDQLANVDLAPPIYLQGWQTRLVDEFDLPDGGGDPQILEKASQIEQAIRRRDDVMAFPANSPLVVDQTVIVNRYGGVRAYDLRTGNLRWPGVFVDGAFEDMFISDFSPIERQGDVNLEMEELFFTQRGWRDATAASLSADAETVYALVDCNLFGAVPASLAQSNQGRSPRLPDRQNLLLAYELQTGRLRKWSLDLRSLPIEEEGNAGLPVAASLGDVFFYSAPLPVHGQLYCVGEERGQTQLFELDPATGRVRWSLPLFNPQEDLIINESRRLSGLMPSYRDGLLVCSTGAGVLTAVDLVQRRLVWTKAYAVVRGQEMQGRLPMMGRFRARTAGQTAEGFLKQDRWLDHRLMLTAGHVVFTPPDSRQLVCLNLADGQPAWEKEIADVAGAYLAGMQGENIILVDHHSVSAVRIHDGRLAWNSAVEIPTPSGRGVLAGNVLLQPVASGAIVAIDVSVGQKLAEITLPAGLVPGNLAAAEGRLLMQTGTRLAAFLSQQETEHVIAQQLADSSQRAQALYARALLKLFRGDALAGIADLQDSWTQDPQPATRQQLVETLLSGLRSDFPRYSSYIPELEQLIESPEQKIELLKVKAHGLAAQDRPTAIQALLALLTELPTLNSVHRSGSSLIVRDDCWILGSIQDLLQSAPPDEQDQLKAAWRDWLIHTLESRPERIGSLSRLWPAALSDPAILISLIPRLREVLSRLELAMTLETFVQSSEPEVRCAALLELARSAHEAGDGESFVDWRGQLQHQLVQIPESHRSAYVEPLEAWDSQPETQQLLASIPQWPENWTVGQAEGRSITNQQLFTIPVFGPLSVELQGWSFHIEYSGANIHILDDSGRLHRTIGTQLPPQRSNAAMSLALYVLQRGPLACIVLADRFLLVDLAHMSDPVQRTLLPPGQSPYAVMGNISAGQPPQPGIRVPLAKLESTGIPGTVGPMSGSVLCYGFEDQLVAIDVATNEELWRRSGIPPGAEILSDAEVTVVMQADGSQLQLFRTLDGQSLGRHPVPENMVRGGWRRADWGRRIPTVTDSTESLTFGLYDPATDLEIWSRDFPSGSLWAPLDQREIGILTPEGNFHILSAATGQDLCERQLPVKTRMQSLRILGFPDQWMVLTSSQPTNAPSGELNLQSANARFHADGEVYCIQRPTGELVWTKELDNSTFRLDYPSRWPVLLYTESPAARLPVPGTQRMLTPNLLSVVAVNRSTGAELARQKFQDLPPDRLQGITDPGFEIQYRVGLNVLVLVPSAPSTGTAPDPSAPKPDN